MTSYVCVAPSGLANALTSNMPNKEQQLTFLRLPHPRTGLPALFLPHDRSEQASDASENASGILEVQAVSPDYRRSWFSGNDTVISDGKLLILTPIDPVFLLIPIFVAIQKIPSSSQFKPLDDVFEEAISKLTIPSEGEDEAKPSAPLSQQDLLTLVSLPFVKKSVERICDFKEITEEITVYRFSRPKLLELLRSKVGKLSEKTAFDSFKTLTRGLAKDGLDASQESATEALKQAGRYRLACNVISQYLPQDIHDELLASYDLSELNAHLKCLKDEEMASKSVAAIKPIDEKPTKGANPAKGKGNASRGVALLNKADIGGMSKLSKFFTKVEKAK